MNAPDIAVDITASNIIFDVAGTIPNPSNSPGSVFIWQIKSISLIGLEGNLIEIQVDISNGIPEFEIVGLPDTSVKEAKKRIESAIKNSGFEFPSKKI